MAAGRDFYIRIADEAGVDAVYLGEVVCSKRAPLFEPHLPKVAERLAAAGKTVVFSTLAEVTIKHDRQLVERVCAIEDALVEANDGAALLHLPATHRAVHQCLQRADGVLPRARRGAQFSRRNAGGRHRRVLRKNARPRRDHRSPGVRPRAARTVGALLSRARAHGRSKDSCQFVCEEDPDGLVLDTLEGRPFLAVNGIQTLSYDYLNLIHEVGAVRAMGVSRFRLSPHDCDMAAVAAIFRAALDSHIAGPEAAARLDGLRLGAPFSNGFYYANRAIAGPILPHPPPRRAEQARGPRKLAFLSKIPITPASACSAGN